MAGLSSFLEQPDYRVLVPFVDSSLDVVGCGASRRSIRDLFRQSHSRSRAMFLRMFTAASWYSESALVQGKYSIER
jgi:gluconate kinase